jgi:hypothetical protein
MSVSASISMLSDPIDWRLNVELPWVLVRKKRKARLGLGLGLSFII